MSTKPQLLKTEICEVIPFILLGEALAQVQHCPLLFPCYINNSPDVQLDVYEVDTM